MTTQTHLPVPSGETFAWPADVLEFAEKHNVKHGLEALRQATHRLYPTSRVKVSLYHDPEIQDLDTILFEVWVKDSDFPDLIAARRPWEDEFYKLYHSPYSCKEPQLSVHRERG